MRSWRAVLVPVDGSLVAEAAIPVAAEVARRAGAPLHLVFVRAPEPLATLPDEVGLLRAQAERGYLASTVRGLEQLAPACLTASLPEGEPVRAFIQYALEAEADLVERIEARVTRGGGSIDEVGGQAAATLAEHEGIGAFLRSAPVSAGG